MPAVLARTPIQFVRAVPPLLHEIRAGGTRVAKQGTPMATEEGEWCLVLVVARSVLRSRL